VGLDTSWGRLSSGATASSMLNGVLAASSGTSWVGLDVSRGRLSSRDAASGKMMSLMMAMRRAVLDGSR